MRNTLTTTDSRSQELMLAALMGCDVRTAAKALRFGPGAIKCRVHRERFPAAAAQLGLPTAEGETR